MARSARSPFENNPLRRRLTALRRRLRMVVTVRGIGWLLALVLFTVAVVGALDWAWHLPPLVRGFLLVGLLSGAGLVALLFLVRPLLDRMDDLTLALRIEERYPSLNDSLASTIQFLEQAERKTMGQDTGPAVKDSLAMRREAVRRAMQKAEGCDFDRVIDTRGLRTAGMSGALAVVVVGALLWLFPSIAWTAVARLIDPFGAHRWPTATTIVLDEYRTRIGRNDAFEVRGRVKGIIPEKAQVLCRLDNNTPEVHEVKLVKEKENQAKLLVNLRPGQQARSFLFQVKANDAETEWFRVEIAPAPTLTALKGHLFFPTYTERSPAPLPDGNGNVKAIAGTVVSLNGSASAPLRAAWLEYHPETPGVALAALLSPVGSSSLPGLLVTSAVADLRLRHGATLTEDRRGFRLRFQPRVNGSYSIHLEDETGLTSHRTYELSIQPDPAPAVVLERPSPLLESLEVLPMATLPLRVQVEDPVYGIHSVWLEYRTHPDNPFRRLPLFEPRLVAANRAVGIAAPSVSPLAGRLRPTQHLIEGRLPLSQLRHPEGSPPREGDLITLRVRADDFDNVTPDKQPGSSSEIEIRVITRAVLDLALNREQARIQQDLTELRQTERDAHRKLTEIENRVAQTKQLSPDDRAELARVEQAQQQVRERLETQGQDSVRGRVERILETLRQNDLSSSAVELRMEAVKRDLERLGREELQQIEAALTEAQKQAESGESRKNESGRRELNSAAERADRQARELDQLAAEKGREEKDRARLTEEARKLKQQANQLRQMAQDSAKESPEDTARSRERGQELERFAQERERLARELEKSASGDTTGKENELLRQSRDHKEAARRLREQARAQLEPQKPERGDVKIPLTEARRRQEEVDKTLSELLQRMEPWSTTREVKSEAREILEGQRQLLDEVEAMQQKNLAKPRAELTPEQRARLDNSQAAQQRLRERMEQLKEKMRRLAEDRKATDPAAAQEMEDALRQAEKGNISAQMKHAQERLEANQLGNAAEEQRKALAELEKLVKNMEDRREAELGRNIEELKKVERKLEELGDEQDRLNKKVKEAEKIADPMKRQEELRRLARQQQEIQKQTQEAARQLSRLRAERASETANQAAKQMEEAVRRLERNEPASEQQQEALDRLDEAVEDSQRSRGNHEEELAREQLGKVADVIKRLKERHDRLLGETGRLYRDAQEHRKWDRDQRIGLANLAANQTLLGEETKAVAERDLSSAEIFSRQMLRAADTMKKAADTLTAHKERVNAKPEDLSPLTETDRLQKLAQRQLQSLLDALKFDDKESARPGRGTQSGGPGQGQGSPSDGIPALAQLKLLRAMQAEVNERTKELSGKHPDPAKLTEEEKRELQSLHREQRAIAELIEEFSRPEPNEGGKNP